MYFTPHTLQVRDRTLTRDEYGRPLSLAEDQWRTVGPCRCDDVSAERDGGDNGVRYAFRFKVVYPREVERVGEGEEVRCLRADGSVRGQGTAKSPMETNYLSYRVLWLE